jgi:hypothetical protein
MEYKPYRNEFDQSMFYANEDDTEPTLTPANLKPWLLQSSEAIERMLEREKTETLRASLEGEKRAYDLLLEAWKEN